MVITPQHLDIPKHISLGFSSRKGGMSVAPFEGLNMSSKRGDSQNNVDSNRQLFLNNFGIDESHLAQPVQISRDGIQVVQSPGIYADKDALITQTVGTYLSVLTADCSPILIWSTAHPVIGAVHSGWQGSERDILGQTLSKMMNEFDVKPAALSMAIGPGLCQDHFEVGPEFSKKFPMEYLKPLPGTDRFHFDNNQYLYDTAVKSGVPATQIEVLSYCSYADHELFYSHRRDGEQTGRMMSVIGIHV